VRRRSFTLGVVAVLSSAGLAVSAAAQSSRSLTGTVRDSAGAPIVDAVVAVVDTNQVAFHARTDARGRFQLTYRAADTARFVVSHVQHLRFWTRLDSLTTGHVGEELDIRLATPSGPIWGNADRPLNIAADTLPDSELEDVAGAAGLPLLRQRSRGGGDPEIRLAIGGGIFVPEDLLILRNRGGRITGEVWHWWGPISPSRSPNELKWWPKHAAELGCPNARPRRAAHFSEANGEAFVVFVCRADGTHYRLIRHGNPDPAASPEAARAAQIARLVTSVMNSPTVQRKR